MDTEADEAPEAVPRPRTRAECEAGPRPCPFVTCRHHLGQIARVPDLATGRERLLVRLSIEDAADAVLLLKETCALDVAERGGLSLEQVGALLGLTRERVRQIEVPAVLRMRALLKEDPMEDMTMAPRRVPSKPRTAEGAPQIGAGDQEEPPPPPAIEEPPPPAIEVPPPPPAIEVPPPPPAAEKVPRRYGLQDPAVRARAQATRAAKKAAREQARDHPAPAQMGLGSPGRRRRTSGAPEGACPEEPEPIEEARAAHLPPLAPAALSIPAPQHVEIYVGPPRGAELGALREAVREAIGLMRAGQNTAALSLLVDAIGPRRSASDATQTLR